MTNSKLTPEAKELIKQRLEKLNLMNCIDGRKVDSRPNAMQAEILNDVFNHKFNNYIVLGGNQSGKSALLRRIASLFLMEGLPDNPYMRKPNWEGKLQAILVAKNHRQLNESLLPGILAFFNEGDVKVYKNSSYVEKIEHKRTGHTIICAIHDQPEQARQRLQSFTSHLVLLDEMPSGASAAKLFEELQARVMINKGAVFASFTPKATSVALKEAIMALREPVGKIYKLSFALNPAVDAETLAARIQQISHLPEHMQQTLLNGDWAAAENCVYHITDNTIQPFIGYSPLFRHIVCVDPALSSSQGLVILAENPQTGNWWVVHAEKTQKLDDVDEGCDSVAKYIQSTRINVHSIVYDAAANYFYLHARKHPVLSQYKLVHNFNKNSSDRKAEMIAKLQLALGGTLFISPHCEELVEELNICHWSDADPTKIVKAQKFHLLDALRYGVDLLPKWTGPQAVQEECDWPTMVQREIRQYNQEARARAAARRVEDAKPGNWRRQNTSRTWRGSRIQTK
jgi:hypothetical protein